MIGILDYGVGNVRAFSNVYTELNFPWKSVSRVEDFKDVTHIILPGVGSFDYAMDMLNNSGMRKKLDHLVLDEKIPVLGVCIGMQMMGNSSEEGTKPGLGWIDAISKEIRFKSNNLPLPHMGWNSIKVCKDAKILNGIASDEYFYFLHSYFLSCKNKNIILAEVEYGTTVTSLVQKENIYGIQQHPEKSHDAGLKLLKNFGLV